MLIGFTGTRKGLRKNQAKVLFSILLEHNKDSTFVHGGAIGSDEVADSYACILEYSSIWVYPCNFKRYNFWINKYDERIRSIYNVMKPLERNRIIAARSNIIIATPFEMTEIKRSGTWATIRYAIEYKKSYIIIFPDGSISKN